MTDKIKVGAVLFVIGFITLCLGIYGLSDSILAAITLPFSGLCFRAWHVVGENGVDKSKD